LFFLLIPIITLIARYLQPAPQPSAPIHAGGR